MASSSNSTLYLEQYLDSLQSLPDELRRNFTLMHNLDTRNKSILQDVDAASDEYLRKVRELNSSERNSEMANIQEMFQKAKEHGEEKVNIAIQTYELVDKHIRKLDSDLAKFEAEMKEKGRLSQTETEDEDDEDEEEEDSGGGNKKSTSNKKGNNGKKKSGANSKEAKAKNKKTKSKEEADAKKGGNKKKKGVAASKETPALPATPSGLLQSVPQEVLDMPVDPNEPTYCLCAQVSYGEMIGCDNSDCPIEWFHFGCMGLTNKPKGKWYCPKCLPQFKKKK